MKYINGINENTYDLLFDDEYLDVDAIDFESSAKLATMEIFTKLKNRGLKYKLLKMYYKNTILDINKITLNSSENCYQYSDKDININFNKISDFLYAPSLITELLSTKRYQKCYARSLNLANLIGDCNILTGYASFNNLKYLHAVVEREIDGINYVYDWTKNLFIKEEDYIKLTHFDVISSCNINDIDKNDPLLNITSLLPYFVFKNELESDLQRNKKILHK